MVQENKFIKIEVAHKALNLDQVKVAEGFFDRLMGLMFKPNLGASNGLLILHCNSIHTCFMRFPIDVVFLDKEFRVVKIIENMKPWKFSWIYFKANKVLELKGESLKGRISVGDQLKVAYV